MLCDFVKELNKLRKSSVESIDNASEQIGTIKEYLHVERTIEHELNDLLNNVRNSRKKTLILLCGSAGDGKSHLLSYLNKNNDLSEFFNIYNDAAESDAKTRTAIETLYDKLYDFRDDNLENPGKSMILAINLGVLSNLIESNEGKAFTHLAQFVKERNILTGNIGQSSYIQDNVFQYISFSDYNLFSLGEDGIQTEYLESIFEKICCKSEDNPFYQSYFTKTNQCPNTKRCPVRHNFDFFSIPVVRQNIAKAICEVIIKDKSVISTREILDFIYDILVHHSFDYDELSESIESKFLDTYIEYSLPMLMYEYSDRSSMIDGLITYDILKIRSQQIDEITLEYNILQDVSPIIVKAIGDTPYSEVLQMEKLNKYIQRDKLLRFKLFRMIARTNWISSDDVDQNNSTYSCFLKYLYWYNKGLTNRLAPLYKMVQECIFRWNSNSEGNYICIEQTSKAISIYEELEIEPYIHDTQRIELDTLEKFYPHITISFRKKNSEIMPISLNLDYTLYQLIYDVQMGYRPTIIDANQHADFLSFFESLLLFGNAQNEIILLDDRFNEIIKGKFSKGVFGYEFKVI